MFSRPCTNEDGAQRVLSNRTNTVAVAFNSSGNSTKGGEIEKI
jgi:hypothetical protein